MNKEYNNILETFVSNGEIHIERHFEQKEVDKIVDCFFKATPFNRPDFYYIDNNVVYIFEHFEVDASLHSDKVGSLYKQARVKADKQLDNDTEEMIKNNPPSKDEISSIGTFTTSVEQNASIDNLKTNFNQIFDNHYGKIEQYKNNLSKIIDTTGKIFKIIFIIEHTTELGGVFIENGKQSHFVLHYADFVLDKLKQSSLIDYCIFLDKNLKYKQFVLVKTDQLQSIYKNKIDTQKNKIHFFNNIMDISAVVYVPNSFIKRK